MNDIDNTLILDEKTLKRIPPVFVFVIILVLGSPIIALNYFGFDFGTMAKSLGYDSKLSSYLIEAQIRGYFRQTLLQWSAFSLAAITVLLSFTQYRLTNDKIALVIGMGVLFSGAVEALHTLVIDGLSPYFIDKTNLDAVIWTLSNSVSALIFIIGLALILYYKNTKKVRVNTFILIGVFILISAFSLIYYAATLIKLPQMSIEGAILSRPYELVYLLLYLFLIIFLYPRIYKQYPYILTNCIFYMGVTQIVIGIYLMVLSSSPYDSAFNIAYFLKIIFYFIPFACLIINYVFSYNAILIAQEKLRLSEQRLKYIAAHDALTNLYNRREFGTLLEKTIEHNNRRNSTFALFVIDLDNFKSINDTLGHIEGDLFLKQFTMQLSSLVRRGDILSRIGGDEFTLISPRLKTEIEAKRLAERIIKGLNIPYHIHGTILTVTVSIGISLFPKDGDKSEKILKNADIAMYSAKKSGKNTYRFYSEKLSHSKHRETEIEFYLKGAIENNELSLCFQPQYNLLTKEIIGAEVLLRWYNKALGNILPNEFIPVAENTGFIISLGNWVLLKTCEQAKRWSERYKSHLSFTINISSHQFENKDFVQSVNEILERTMFPASNLNLDIPESLLVKNDSGIFEELQEINSLGATITIDDFGMGYSSLNHLKSLPIKTLKIDKLFIAEIKNSTDKVVVIDTIIKLANELGMSIMAEGIETEEQLDYLLARNCLQGQGFYLSKPLTAQEFESIAFE
ncbi:sensory box protein (plasmid) [Legionella adelaidensis]|uniref:Sensory box protein n=1 Tax=Legionella adelaidensis TaxID=45056 RepID=A0A0W0R5R4_9GAMM|nr:EAL domain-containing protein [Legionella adelaidensis]KTC66422.1 sensory box protein [Legionella adelaidensis]VEH85020.1 sensory box protein [Legionella adelaidensis]